jgi:hypothetical protein
MKYVLFFPLFKFTNAKTQMATGAPVDAQDGMDNDVFDDDVPTK